MTDGHVFFPGDHLIEGVLEWPDDPIPKAGVVVAHPHPLHGGTMAQPVVFRTARACRDAGMAALRFNFRGVGESHGVYSGTEEYRDVQAAAAFLRGRMAGAAGDAVPGPETPPLALAGYSFGSGMVANAVAGEVPVKALVLIAFLPDWPDLPPETYSRLAGFTGPVLAVSAENDDLGGYPEDVERLLKRLGLDFTLVVVEGAGHFFEGRHREVGRIVADFLSEKLALSRYALD
jgi:alpha/beta superfamily hydrolase